MSDKYYGQHLFVKKVSGSYTHHGLGVGGGRVIHYSGLANNLKEKGRIEEISLEAFSKEAEIWVKPHLNRVYDAEQSILRAGLRLGEEQYHVLHNNCEHFVEWCITGQHRSQQALRGKLLYSAGIGTRALIGVKAPVSFLVGAAAGYAYVNQQGLKKVPNLKQLEEEYARIMTQQRLGEPN